MKPPLQSAQSVLRFCAFAVTSLLLAGCQSISPNSAQLRIVDASADSGVLDLYQNGSGFAYNLGFGTLTSYVAMSPGEYKLAADKSGSRQTLAESSVHLAAGKQYTDILGGGLANLQQTLLVDLTTPAPAGQVNLRFVHQAGRAGPVDVYLVGSGGRLATTTPIAPNLTLGTVEGYLTVPAGTYAVDIVPAGTVLTNATVTLLSGPQQEYPSGAVRTVMILDQELPTVHPSAAIAPGVSIVVASDVDPQ
jgi:hypothetical protein